RELAPAPDCYIDAADFESPAELAAHLRRLVDDEAAYAELHAWRQRPLAPAFQALVDRVRQPTFVRLAAAIRQAQGRSGELPRAESSSGSTSAGG
ncbi:MAG: glycosyltransferase family 10, partial [Acidobacteriota bacterium]